MYKKGFDGWRKHIDFILLDMICLNLAVWGAYVLRHGVREEYALTMPLYIDLALVLTAINLIVTYCFNTYKGVIQRGYYREFIETVKQIGFMTLFLFFYLFTVKKSDLYSRVTLYLFFLLYFLLSYTVRILWKKHLCNSNSHREERSVLVITDPEQAEEFLADLKTSRGEPFNIAGIVLTKEEDGRKEILDVPVVSALKDVTDYVCREWVDEVFIQTTGHQKEMEQLSEQFLEMGVTVHFGLFKNSVEESSRKQFVEKLGGYTVLTNSINVATPIQLLAKRMLDILGGLVGCLMTGLIYLVIAPFIKKESPGPVFFSQIRVGKNGRKFKIYKFRSMYLDAEERKRELMEQNRVKDGFMFKLDFDPRIIGSKKLPDGTVKRGIGNIIRDYSLDEFPQFYNVLKGDMSLVGTRPPTVDEWEKYELHHRARLATKPGITGMWQVSGRSNITDFEEVVRLDTKYITEWSFGLDIKILLKTVVSVVKKDGSM